MNHGQCNEAGRHRLAGPMGASSLHGVPRLGFFFWRDVCEWPNSTLPGPVRLCKGWHKVFKEAVGT